MSGVNLSRMQPRRIRLTVVFRAERLPPGCSWKIVKYDRIQIPILMCSFRFKPQSLPISVLASGGHYFTLTCIKMEVLDDGQSVLSQGVQPWRFWVPQTLSTMYICMFSACSIAIFRRKATHENGEQLEPSMNVWRRQIYWRETSWSAHTPFLDTLLGKLKTTRVIDLTYLAVHTCHLTVPPACSCNFSGRPLARRKRITPSTLATCPRPPVRWASAHLIHS